MRPSGPKNLEFLGSFNSYELKKLNPSCSITENPCAYSTYMRPSGIEPDSTDWQPAILPIN